ncbi:arginine repressor [Ectobacillus polymachus]|uniref:arginine repressor n=1 Tax=Ectobacillus polymachus TaxID=1508806 RepID=UPI003A8BDF3A
MKKEKRQQLIKQLVKENEIGTQERLVELLKSHGVLVTQATISRDIRELHLTKVTSPSGVTIYTIFTENSPNVNMQLKKKLKEIVVKIDYVDRFTIIKTAPGNAHVIGALLDSLDWKEKIGSVCGNNTCLVIAPSKADSEIIKERLKLICKV